MTRRRFLQKGRLFRFAEGGRKDIDVTDHYAGHTVCSPVTSCADDGQAYGARFGQAAAVARVIEAGSITN
jgi:hypothetical protein